MEKKSGKVAKQTKDSENDTGVQATSEQKSEVKTLETQQTGPERQQTAPQKQKTTAQQTAAPKTANTGMFAERQKTSDQTKTAYQQKTSARETSGQQTASQQASVHKTADQLTTPHTTSGHETTDRQSMLQKQQRTTENNDLNEEANKHPIAIGVSNGWPIGGKIDHNELPGAKDSDEQPIRIEEPQLDFKIAKELADADVKHNEQSAPLWIFGEYLPKKKSGYKASASTDSREKDLQSSWARGSDPLGMAGVLTTGGAAIEEPEDCRAWLSDTGN